MFGKKFFRNLIIVSLIVVFAVLLMTVIDKSTLKMAYKYYTLTNKPNKSDTQFNIPTGRISLNKDGTKSINFEIPKELASIDIEVTEEEFEGATPDDDRQQAGPDNTQNNNGQQSVTGLVSIMGDSISTFDGTMPTGYAGFYPSNSDVTSISDTWWGIYIDKKGMSLGVNGSWSGSKTSGSGDDAGQSDARVNALGNQGEPSTIIVYMGTNDLWDGVTQSEFGAAYETMLSKIKSKYPNANVICLGLTQLSSSPNSGTVTPLDSGNGDSKAFSSIIQDKAGAAGFTYVSLEDCWSYTEASTYCTDEMVHPNKEGMKKIAAKIP